ncbi:MAG: hypothetical protein COT25_03420 [Candidatus Kerfeldbacteria bacterium CG08_land_8_20_14_0_20_42_7]|uniref:Glycosyltransferase 2-like domain-containing protein n=1 Tax=Candidatus Kerfeldbacteria bacterium CG08_land_8_20_14_0_20_42_7 TaxID=2014245 RepID=A0A2H0YS96_9BACT|nr:MAG: hypothetical protein COT25_03420 [Candidatus Kerfeldbacteria bacterium CG08_land_8_20_14_0_20_42_7]
MTTLCSIVIPTLNRQEVVRSLANQLFTQTFAEIEIIIVDQSIYPDVTLAQDKRLVYLHRDAQSTTLARNAGVDVSHGEIILFLDDDVEIPDTGLVARIMKFFTTHPTYAGLALTIDDKNVALNRENQHTNSRVMSVTWSGRVLPFAHGPEQDVCAPRGGGVAYRKNAILKVGGFDSRYVGNAMREETDFSLRVVRGVGPIRYIPALLIIHLALRRGGSRTADRMQWYRDFFANEILFQLTHFSRLALPLFFVRKLRPILACMFWYGKGRLIGFTTPWKGFYDGYNRFKEKFLPYTFS